MTAPRIRIAAALIEDGHGRMLLVRKQGTIWFMQAGGKIEAGESAIDALRRELREEIGLSLADDDAVALGCHCAPAANEPDHIVDAELFHIVANPVPAPGAEIAEAIWITPTQAADMPLAPLTRDLVMRLLRGRQGLPPQDGSHETPVHI